MKKKSLIFTIFSASLIAACSNGDVISDTQNDSCGTCIDSMCCRGNCVDITSDRNNCGGCGITCDEDEQCVHSSCTNDLECSPKTCAKLGAECGYIDDGCGGKLKCGKCDSPDICSHNHCIPEDTCTPKTCEELNAACGSIDDECGNAIECGTCSGTQTCSQNKCIDTETCTPKTCEGLKAQCGSVNDGCGNAIECGTCSGTQTCSQNKCIDTETCTPKTCEALKSDCGTVDDGCGNTIECGSCDAPQTCKQNKCVEPETCKPSVSCFSKQYWCGSLDDGCGQMLDCGKCPDGQACKSGKCDATETSYPIRKSIKGIQPDSVDPSQIIGNEGAGVAVNLVWFQWQPNQSTSCSNGQVSYDGYCFSIEGSSANEIKTYSDNGLVVTAILWGVPGWAASSCNTSVTVGHSSIFCAPRNGADFGRFAGFLAHYFNGQNGHGRVADFVIHNEVNSAGYFNYGQGANPTYDAWTSKYAESYIAAYDAIKKEQPNAKVLMSFDHFFDKDYALSQVSINQRISVKSFIKTIVPKLGDREWRVAFHSYPPDLLSTSFGANDMNNFHGVVTFGNIGILAGWLRQNYPNNPHAWEIQLTENGINGLSQMHSAQKSQLCQAFRNVLGTPGIENFIYHRLKDHPDETAQGLALGLWDPNNNPKPAWEVWALANRNASGYPSCGFETLPYIPLRRGKSSAGLHWLTTRQFPSGFSEEKTWKILRDKFADTQMIYECRVGGAAGDHTMPSTDVNCENQFNMGPLGYVYRTQVKDSVPIYRCFNASKFDHFVSDDANCEGSNTEGLIGFVMP